MCHPFRWGFHRQHQTKPIMALVPVRGEECSKGSQVKRYFNPSKRALRLIIRASGLSNLLEFLKPFKHGVYEYYSPCSLSVTRYLNNPPRYTQRCMYVNHFWSITIISLRTKYKTLKAMVRIKNRYLLVNPDPHPTKINPPYPNPAAPSRGLPDNPMP